MTDRAAYANANAALLPLADKSVHMIATSPPYFGLRSYDTGANKAAELGAEPLHDCLAWARGDDPCGACYVCNLREWAAEMWRVLRDDGCMFLNLGDSYASSGKAGPIGDKSTWHGGGAYDVISLGRAPTAPGLKPKDLVGIPWRVALALQADGWYLRSDIIWAKPNPMPESVKDRPTKSHEYVFVLTKSARYFWDAEGVRENWADSRMGNSGTYKTSWDAPEIANARRSFIGGAFNEDGAISGRNIRTVWTIATQPYSGAHFATWPAALVETMVKAGTSERGVCPECGKPWERVVERTTLASIAAGAENPRPKHKARQEMGLRSNKSGLFGSNSHNSSTPQSPIVVTTGWRPTCAHADLSPIPAIVLDPFCGSGTTLLVARQLGRVGLGFDLSETYLRDNAAVRLGHDKLAAWGRGIVDTGDYADLFRAHANGNGARSDDHDHLH